jgi:hypothetical protein
VTESPLDTVREHPHGFLPGNVYAKPDKLKGYESLKKLMCSPASDPLYLYRTTLRSSFHRQQASYLSEPEVGRKGDGVVDFDVDSRRQRSAQVTSTDVEAPSAVGAGDSNGVD